MEKIIIAGFGGQGVLSLGQLIAYAAMYEGKEVTWLPSYGPEMRGGTANCSVVVDDKPVASPVIAVPDCLIAMNKPSLHKFENTVRPGGTIIVNSSLIEDKVVRSDVNVRYIDANAVAHSVGNDKAASIVILGAYIKASGLFPESVMLSTIEKVFAAKPKFIPSNKNAFLAGFAV
jgi:2-oxoglutarate ferredoxin oxidoreductase subunit gamma